MMGYTTEPGRMKTMIHLFMKVLIITFISEMTYL